MASDQPLEELHQQQDEEAGEEYNPQEIEKTGDQHKDKRNADRDSRSKSPPALADGKSTKKDIDCKVFLLNGDVMSVTVDVS